MFKNVQVVAHTTGGEVKSAPERFTEREYDQLKDGLKKYINDLNYVEFDTEDGWVVIPSSQLPYLEVRLT